MNTACTITGEAVPWFCSETMPRICSIEGCDKEHSAYGLCGMHYMRKRRHGDVNADHVYKIRKGFIKDGVGYIPLTKNKYAVVDSDNVEFLSQWNWQCRNGYAKRDEFNRQTKKLDEFLMHRVIINTPKGMVTDHIDGDKLNNKRTNLRACSNGQNIQNSNKFKKSKSLYKGVRLVKGRWTARIFYNKKRYFLGGYSKESDAAEAYNKAAMKYFGEFARLNKV